MITSFENLLEDLAQARVEFILVGGLAVCLNGFVRMTEDVDILVDNAPANVSRLLECLKSFGEGSGATLTLADFSNEPGALRISEDFVLNIFVQMDGRTFVDLKNQTRVYEFPSGAKIAYLSRIALIEVKKGSHRDKDQFDVTVLQRLKDEDTPGQFQLDSVRRANLPGEPGA